MASEILVQEKVGKGHPDKICDFIAETVKNYLINIDEEARTAIEVCAFKVEQTPPYSRVIIFGEYNINQTIIDLEAKIKAFVIKKLIENLTKAYYDYLNIKIEIALAKQSGEIKTKSEAGAGDQGIIAHHYKESIENLFEKVTKVKEKLDNWPSIGKDWKFLIDCKKKTIIVNFHFPHYLHEKYSPDKESQKIENYLKTVWKDFEPDINYYHQGSILSDSGLTGRKIFCDFPFGYVWGGGAVWGKDASKVDNSALLYLRAFAKSLAQLGNYKHVKVTLVYNIGVSTPTACEIIADGEELPSASYINQFHTKNLDNTIRNQTTAEIFKKTKDQTKANWQQALKKHPHTV